MAATLTTIRTPFLLQLIAVILLLALPACSSRVARPSPPAKVLLPSQEVIAGLLQNGKQAVAQGQYDRAIGLFRRLQDGYPNAPERSEAMLLLAQVFEKRGETIPALVEYRKLASEFPQAPQATLARIKIPELERQLPVVRPPQESRIIGLHVWPDALAGLDDRELGRLRQSGTNTLFVSVTRETGVYFKTDWAPVLQDRLSALVGAAHRQGMQVWASLSVRRMDWVHSKLEWADWKFNSQTGGLERVETLDLLHPALRDYLVGLLTDLAGTEVDGIFLAADPPSEASEGFSTTALRKFEKDMGQPVDPSRLLSAQGRERSLGYAPEFWRWLGWKQREQSKSVLGVMEAVRAAFPGLMVAVEVHPEAVTNPQAAMAMYAEDLLDLRRYRVDYIALPVTSAQGSLAAKAAEIVRGERLLLLVDPTDKSGVKPATLPVGTGLIYKEKSGQPRLTNQGR
ncbi:MAG: tetratricopeptide repeat protein [Nitrospirae bacterium]|nr:tetratricopeptide repeat protein [Nitrospirota bacterium]